MLTFKCLAMLVVVTGLLSRLTYVTTGFLCKFNGKGSTHQLITFGFMSSLVMIVTRLEEFELFVARFARPRV